MAALSHCCFNHPWPLEGALYPARWPWIGLNKTAGGKADIINVPQMWTGNPSWVRAAGNSVGTAVLLVLTHTLWCSPITLDLLWRAHSFLCMVLSSLSRARRVLPQAPCHRRASQSKWPPCGSAPHWAQKLVSFRGVFILFYFLQFVVACSDFCLKQKEKYTVQGRESTVIHCISW